MSKRCNKCDEIKPVSEFHADRRRANDGLQACCKACKTRYHVGNLEASRKRQTKYYASNRELLRERAAEYRTSNRDTIRERAAEYRTNNPNVERERSAERRISMTGRAGQLFNSAKRRAKKAAIPFSMSIHRIEVALMVGKCERTGVAFDMFPHEKYQYNPFAPSIDKIDAFGGYTDDNVKVVCNAYNIGKQQMTHDEFVAFCKTVVEYCA